MLQFFLTVFSVVAILAAASVVLVPICVVWRSPLYSAKDALLWTFVFIAFPLLGTIAWALFDRR